MLLPRDALHARSRPSAAARRSELELAFPEDEAGTDSRSTRACAGGEARNRTRSRSMKAPLTTTPAPMPLESHRSELLDGPPEAAIRALAMPFLDDASAAARLLESGRDSAALHDFRVALRRTRTLLRAYRDLLRDSVSKKLARALRDLARSTGSARDAEVQLEWLAAQRERLKPAARRACSWMEERLEERRQAAY